MIDQLLEIFGRDSFQENIVAGLVVMVLDVVIVALAIGAFVKWLGDREWRGTRRHLAYVLLNSMDSVAGEINAAIEETDGRLVLNKDIRLRLQHLKIALSNFHTQTIVHLPAMRPPLSEKLSALTTRISKLEETIHAMDWHISALGAAIGSYDAKMPDAGWISPEFFGSEKNPLKDMPFHHMNFSIKSGSSLSEQNYIFLEITQSIERINSLASAVDELVESYSDGWKGIYFDEKNHNGVSRSSFAIARIEGIRVICARLRSYHDTMRTRGFYLVTFAPDVTTLEPVRERASISVN